MIDKSLLVRVFGHTATLFHHDTLVIDRWLWLKKKLPITKDNIDPMLAWLIVLPLRIIPFIFDKPISKIFNWPGYSICMEAYKPKQQ